MVFGRAGRGRRHPTDGPGKIAEMIWLSELGRVDPKIGNMDLHGLAL
jgi:hypothetical protein